MRKIQHSLFLYRQQSHQSSACIENKRDSFKLMEKIVRTWTYNKGKLSWFFHQYIFSLYAYFHSILKLLVLRWRPSDFHPFFLQGINFVGKTWCCLKYDSVENTLLFLLLEGVSSSLFVFSTESYFKHHVFQGEEIVWNRYL